MRASVHSPAGYLRAHRHLKPPEAPNELPGQRFAAWWAMWLRSHPDAMPAELEAARARIARECGV